MSPFLAAIYVKRQEYVVLVALLNVAILTNRTEQLNVCVAIVTEVLHLM